jgi:hypothetical protein
MDHIVREAIEISTEKVTFVSVNHGSLFSAL